MRSRPTVPPDPSELPAEAEEARLPPVRVAGIGASAGGLEAFTRLLHHLPSDTGMAFVLVQHLNPDHKSILAELLARETSLPVVEASDGLALAADSVYVIPAGKDMTLDHGLLRLAHARPGACTFP